jgi:hypothetical protein
MFAESSYLGGVTGSRELEGIVKSEVFLFSLFAIVLYIFVYLGFRSICEAGVLTGLYCRASHFLDNFEELLSRVRLELTCGLEAKGFRQVILQFLCDVRVGSEDGGPREIGVGNVK